MQLHILTKQKKEVVDITDLINSELKKIKVTGNLCILFIKHTTAALTTADLDPGTDLDMMDALENILPKLNYRHPHNPAHVTDHIMASMIGPSLVIPIQNGELDLGMWQRVVLIEFDGPRERKIMFTLSP
jgi:secondary thiamine-phosphate synthase enzyme